MNLSLFTEDYSALDDVSAPLSVKHLQTSCNLDAKVQLPSMLGHKITATTKNREFQSVFSLMELQLTMEAKRKVCCSNTTVHGVVFNITVITTEERAPPSQNHKRHPDFFGCGS